MKFKKIFALGLIPLFVLLNLSIVSAKNVALAVMDSTHLDPVHELRLYNILTSMNFTVTPIDYHSNVNFANFDLLVVAGRPYSGTPLPQPFAQNLPVNSMPTIAIDYHNLYNWGWVSSGGANAMQSGSPQSVYIASNNHPITSGYSTGQRVFIHNQSALDAIDIVAGTSNFTTVAFLDSQGDGGIAFAAPNTALAGGRSIASNSASIFFGTTFPAYWTSDAEAFFRNAVNWITNLNFTPPTSPVLSGPSMSVTSSAQYTWTAASGVNGIQDYEVQVSTISDFSVISADVKTSSLSYTLTGMMDGQRYYVRVRSLDFLNLPSQWSNTVSTIADFTPIILTINSPSNGLSLQLGQTVNVDVSVNSPRVQAGSLCTIWIGQTSIGTLLFNQSTNKCSGNVTVPLTLGGDGLGTTTFSVSIPDQFGATNSTSVNVIFNRQITVSVSTSSSSYSSGSQVLASGSVKTADNSAPVFNATVFYSVSTLNGTATTGSNGNYNFTLVAGGNGNYEIDVQANYKTLTANSSTTFAVGSQLQPSGSSGGSASISLYPILFVDSPDNVTANENSDNTFNVIVRNGGNVQLHTVKLSIQGINVSYDINPNLFNMDVGDSKNVIVTLHIPQDSAGTYQFKLAALAYEAQQTNNINLIVKKVVRVTVPKIDISSLDLPEFTKNVKTLVNATLSNSGNASATASVSISLPTGWTAVQNSQQVTLNPGDKKQITFSITPTDSNGNITVSGTYQSGSSQVSFSKTSGASFAIPTQTNPELLSGALGLLSNPTAILIFAGAAAVFVILAYKFEFGSTATKYRTSRWNSPRNKKPKPGNSDYDSWEHSHGG